jgi:hypothetical protein
MINDTYLCLDIKREPEDMSEETTSLPKPAADLLYPQFRDTSIEFSRHSARQEHLHFFQFPTVLPSFERNEDEMDVDTEVKTEPNIKQEEIEDESLLSMDKSNKVKPLEGRIGKLKVYKSGRMRLWINDIEMEVSK